METVGTRIEALGKKKLGKSGRALAEALGITYETLRKWKTGEGSPSKPRQEKLAVALGEPISVFMYGLPATGGTPLAPDEARLLAAYRALLKDDKADMLAKAEAKARELEELSIRWQRERMPLVPFGKRSGNGG